MTGKVGAVIVSIYLLFKNYNTKITAEIVNLEQEITNDDANIFKDWNDVLSMFQDCLKENKAISLTPEQIQRLMNVAPSTSKGKEIDLTEVNDN